ncbi:transglycosylase SLT domain-containing protein [Streptomyces sp. NPDC004542]|uniref:transglycosylase SLT domain-containing protein n=1 Tax=Streptomyces sp. NPDC004542 TaxID=3154281 RepID=UPI0033B073CD
MSAAARLRRTPFTRIARRIAVAGTGAAVLALPLMGATSASAATTTSAPTAATAATSTVAYSNNLDGWIRESLAIMAQKGIPGSYNGIYRNVMRESSGNPMAINLWDSNAAAGIPSKGLLQVIDPTFNAYHVAGTSWNIYDPVANITAACNYAAHRYGSIDNVFGAY